MPWTYMLRCSDGTYYVGSTVDLDGRIEAHQAGMGAEYTKRRLPVELVYAAEFETIAEAFGWEKRVQGWSRAKREALIRGDFAALPGLSMAGWKRRRLAEVEQPPIPPPPIAG